MERVIIAASPVAVLKKRDKSTARRTVPLGLLLPVETELPFQLQRYAPSPRLAPFVERYWVIRWSLAPGASRWQSLLAYPSADLVFQGRRARVWGVQQTRVRRRFTGSGLVVGVKFRPGAVGAFCRVPPASLTDRGLAADTVLSLPSGLTAHAVAHSLTTCRNDAERIAQVERLLLACTPTPDVRAALAAHCVDLALHRGISRVDALARAAGLTSRSLERLFERYLGVTPRWMVGQFRAMRAVARADRAARKGWATVAADLGYADQAHLTNDFRARIGMSPARYRAGRSRLRHAPADF